eukprot:CAMPEP_0174855000 /NCGR_PEP_ID=MMETSP1114-20130205/32227_1 /TAXON_ID=312471 /ORGANISM="Neobodo designis, Strain CCAP 1951/1" /LENGTH=113 /DNA_ID=CAMNT_0016089711 /DNA_START=58 /DNA_END=396 /DNA_ORIENTATION=+
MADTSVSLSAPDRAAFDEIMRDAASDNALRRATALGGLINIGRRCRCTARDRDQPAHARSSAAAADRCHVPEWHYRPDPHALDGRCGRRTARSGCDIWPVTRGPLAQGDSAAW